MLKDSESIKIRNSGGFIDSSNPFYVQNTGGFTDVTNAIREVSYNLNTAAFSETTNITNDFILDNIELNFSTTEEKTITILSSGGTTIWSDINTDQSVFLSNMNIGFNSGENITVNVTQFSSSGTMDCILRIKE